MIGSETPYTSRVSLYLKVANILRSRIVKGIWRRGDRLPNIIALCEEFQVGRITVRQALQLLVEEGLVSSSRGRGTYVASDHVKSPARDKLADHLNSADYSQAIQVLDISRSAPLPASLSGSEETFDRYVCIRKLHTYNQTPYCLMDIYVARALFDLFPKEDVSQVAVATLVSRHATDPIARARQSLTVGFADYETSRILDCAMAAPIAEVDRFFLDADGRILSRGHYLYRGDMFVMETEHMGDPLSDLPTGWLPDVKNK